MILRGSREDWFHLVRAQSLGRTLDAACGEGDFGEELLVEGSGMTHLVGVDIDENALSVAKSHFGHHAPGSLDFRFYRDTLDEVAAGAWLVPQFYDTVAMALALHHVRDPGKVVALLWSLVAAGGRLIISEVIADGLTPAQETARDLHHLKAWTDRLVGVPHNGTFTQGQVIEILSNSLSPRPTMTYELLVPEEEEMSWDPKVLDARIQFIADYILWAKELPEYRELRREFTRLAQKIAETGYCPPPRLNFIAVRP